MVVCQMGKLRLREAGLEVEERQSWRRSRSLPPSSFHAPTSSRKALAWRGGRTPHPVRAGAGTRRGWAVMGASGWSSALIKQMVLSQEDEKK